MLTSVIYNAYISNSNKKYRFNAFGVLGEEASKIFL
jgi:hypothetical protein